MPNLLLTESAPMWWILASTLGVMSAMFDMARTLTLPRLWVVAAVAVLATGTGAAFLAGPRMELVMVGVMALVAASVRLGFLVGSHQGASADL